MTTGDELASRVDETISRDKYDSSPTVGGAAVRPDNGRDVKGSGVLRFVISEVDARL